MQGKHLPKEIQQAICFVVIAHLLMGVLNQCFEMTLSVTNVKNK